MKFVDNWKEAWTWFSVQAISLAVIWETLPQENKEVFFSFVPDAVEPYVTTILLVVAAIGRVIDQQKAKPDVDTE
jgi:hypothetical protein